MSVAERLEGVRATLPEHVRLVAVSKFQPTTAIEEAYRAGQRVFGESRALELRDKHAILPDDIRWHFIGTLQTNKIKYIIPFVAMIESIDSPELLEAVNARAAQCGRTVPCLLQLHIAAEETKHGFTFDECRQMLDDGAWRTWTNVSLCGMMGMATFTDDKTQVETEFHRLHTFFDEIKTRYFADYRPFCELSMGMSDDYSIAIEQGSTSVRIGSKLFGARN
jgi:pyridoxal phosphate enzyme (YggS family)